MRNSRDAVKEDKSDRGGDPPAPGMDRLEFLKRSGRFAGLAIAAGSLGWLAGCGSRTLSRENQPAPQSGTAQSSSPSTPTAPQSQDTAPATEQKVIDCRFFEDGICSRTGEKCTQCILR